MSSHLDAALRYATERGWPVFPLQERGKQPIELRGFHAATTDQAKIRDWWTRTPGANIGIPCGPKTFCVIDVDAKHGGIETLAELTKQNGLLPDTLIQQTGGGGVHFCFKPDPRVGNTASRIGPGIDTRGNDKGYIVVAPSIHDSGNPYVWTDESKQLAEVPAWLIERLTPKPVPAPVASPQRTAVLDDHRIEERARAYLQDCDPAVQGAGGHGKLLWACTAMVHGFELDSETAFQLLAQEYNPRCSPPWDLTNPKELREFRRKIEQGRLEKKKPRGWLLEEMDRLDDMVLEHARSCAAQLIANEQSKTITPTYVQPAPAMTVQEDAILDLPDHVLKPPGLVGEIASYINSTARKPQPLLALATSYAFCGALFGRKIRDEWDLRTNIYCLGVAESGAGKDHSRQVVKGLCAAAGIHQDLLGGEEVTSDAAIASRLKDNPSILFLWDEIGHMLASIMDRAASGHRRGIVPYLMRLTGSASTVFIGKEYADGERSDIIQPNVCIYGTTVPGVLYQGLSSSEIRDGLLGRLLVFRATDDDPDVNDGASRATSISPELVERVTAWFKFEPDPPADAPNIQRVAGVHQVTVPTSPEAQAIFFKLRADVRKRRNKAIASDSPQAPLWSRVEEHARRLALILAGGDVADPKKAVIQKEHAESACQLAMYCVMHFIRATAANIADSETERWLKRIRTIIHDTGEDGITQRDLTRRTQSLSRRMRDDILQSLEDAGYMIRAKRPGQRAFRLFAPPFGLPYVTGEE